MKHPHLAEAYRLMHHRGITQQSLADAVMTRRSYVQRVLAGYERQGRTWQRIRAVLPADIVALLEAVPPPVGARQPRAPSMTPAAVAKRRVRARGVRTEVISDQQSVVSEDSAEPTFSTLCAAIAAIAALPKPRAEKKRHLALPVNPLAGAFINWRHQHSA